MRTSWLRALILVVVLVGGVITPVAPVGDARAAPSGFVTVPDANVHEDLPVDQSLSISKEDLEGSVMASDNASTTEIVVTTPERAGGYLDNGSSVGGGSIALVIKDDTNHAGRQIAIPADAVKGAIGRIPEAVHGTHEDGTEWTSQVRAESGLLIFEVPSFSSNTVTFSGEVRITGPFTDGSSANYQVTSLDSVDDFSINVTGALNQETDTSTISGSSGSVSVAGNRQPVGPSGDSGTDPRITYEYNEDTVESSDPSGQTSQSFSVSWAKLDSVEGALYNDGSSETTATVHLDVDGSEVASKSYSSVSTVTRTSFSFSSINEPVSQSVTVSVTSNNGLVEFNPTLDGGGITITEGPPSSFTLTHGSTSTTVSNYSGGAESIRADLSTGSKTLSVDTGSSWTLTAEYTERTQTIDPTITVNGHSTSHSGGLANGSTVSLSANESWIATGENTVNVSVGDGSLSADAPEPTVDLNYRHEATDEVSVQFASRGWTEKYNVSRTFASSQQSPTLTVPFQGSVTEILRLEERTDDGSWSSVPSSRYSLDGSKLVVQLDDGDGDGDVDAGSETSVRVTGRYVEAVNGAITVTDPILPGEDTDVEFRVDNKGSGFYIDLSKAPESGVRYTYQESWSNPESHMIVSASGEKRLKLPNAPDGGSARVTLVPVTVTPESGDAKVSVADADEPTITMGAGSSSGDDVTIRYLEASTGTTYNLYSTSRDRIVAKEEANAGSVTFVEDDSAESLMINTTSSGGGGAGGMFGDTSQAADYGTERPVLVMGALAALVVGLVWATGRTGIRGRSRWALVGTVSVALGLISLEALNPGSISRYVGDGIQELISQVGTVVPLAGIAAVTIVGYMVVSWWQSRKADASTPDTKVTFSLGDKKK